jgi:ABC-type sugar transport system substrate-binding protein
VGPVLKRFASLFAHLRSIGVVAVVAAIVLGVALTACGGGGGGGSDSGSSTAASGGGSAEEASGGEESSGETATASALTEKISPAKLQETIEAGFGPGTVKAAELPAVAVESFEVASQKITPEEEAKLEECISNSSCETGHGELTIGVAETFAGNPWRAQLRAVITLQLLRYPQVKKIIYTDGNGELQKTLSNFKSLISQGVDGITGVMDLGAAMLPVAKEATAQGIPVVPIAQVIPNATEADVATQVKPNGCEVGAEMAKVVIGEEEPGTAAVYTGTPGNPWGAEWMPCAEEELEKAGWDVSITGNTDWTPQGTQEAAAAYISKGGATALLYDYSPTVFNEKLESAGKVPPTQAVQAADFAFFNSWQEASKAGNGYEAAQSASELQFGYTAATVLVEKALGGGSEIPLDLEMPLPVVSLKEYESEYSSTLPEGLSFNSLLPDSILSQLTS